MGEESQFIDIVIEDAAEDFGSVEPYIVSHLLTVCLLMNCPQLPMLTNAVNGCLTCRGKSYCAEAEVADSCTRNIFLRCDCGY